mgnify:CR=1 FL=1
MTKTILLRIVLIGTLLFIGQIQAALYRPTLKSTPSKTQEENSLINSHDYQKITATLEAKYGIPGKLLTAIARVESGKSPWAVNARGRSHKFRSKEQALKFIQTLKKQGVKNINVGYMQINLQSHERKFRKLEDVLTPYHNIAYAAKLLKQLHKSYGSWEAAIRFYHSGSSVYNLPYQRKVFRAWGNACTSQSKAG